MNMKAKYQDFSLPVLVHIFQLIFIFSAYRLEPDPHHDGVIYGAGIGSSQGLIPHRDFLSQYGPIQPIVNGAWLDLFGTTLLNLRVFYCFLLVISSWLVYSMLTNYVGKSLALLIPSVWILTGPFGLPWPSILGTFLVLVSIKLIDHSITKMKNHENFLITSILSGSSIGLCIFVRIHIAVAGVLVTLALLYFVRTKQIARNLLFSWVSGFIGTFSLCVLVMAMNGSLTYYIDQSIIWSAKFYGRPNFSKSYFVNWLWYPATLVFILIIIFIIWKLLKRNSSKLSKIIVLVTITSMLVAFSQASLKEKTGRLTLRNPDILLITFADRIIHSIGYVMATLVVITATYMLVRYKSLSKMSDVVPALYVIYGLGVFVQLYPLYDNYHLWMISPVFLLVSAIVIPEIKSAPTILAIKLILASFVLALCIQQTNSLQYPRYTYQSDVLLGMQSNWVSAKGTDRTLVELQKITDPIKYLCGHGLYAASNGWYQAQDREFYRWTPRPELIVDTSTKYVFFCDSTKLDYKNYLSNGWKISFEIPISVYFEGATKIYWNTLLENKEYEL